MLLMLKAFLRERIEGDHQINIEQYNEEIDQALAEMGKGEYISQEEMEKLASEW